MAINTSTTTYGSVPHKPFARAIAGKVKKVYGFDYPLGIVKGKGFFNKISGKKLIYNNIRQLLSTERGERIMLPDYGVSLKKYLFEPLDGITRNLIRTEIMSTITEYEPRVKIVNLVVNPLDEYGAEGLQALIINLTLRIKEEVNTQFDIQVKIN